VVERQRPVRRRDRSGDGRYAPVRALRPFAGQSLAVGVGRIREGAWGRLRGEASIESIDELAVEVVVVTALTTSDAGQREREGGNSTDDRERPEGRFLKRPWFVHPSSGVTGLGTFPYTSVSCDANETFRIQNIS